MAEQKITALTAFAPPAVTDVLPIVDLATSQTKKVTIAEIIKKAIVFASNASNQALSSGDTYLTGSAITVGSRLQVGTTLKWRVIATKTAAGVAAPVFNMRFGTAGTTADTSRVTLTGVAQTAAADTGVWEITAVVEAVGASGKVFGFGWLTHALATTGFGTSDGAMQSESAAFDMTNASLKAGLSLDVGASGAWTVKLITTELINAA